MKKIGLYTLGCKLNQYETDSIASDFVKEGYQVVPFDQEADVYVINSCTVTNKADRKSRNIIGRARKNPKDPLVVVTGCYADSAKEELEQTDGIDYVVNNARKSQVFSLVDGHFKGEVQDSQKLEQDWFSYSLPEEAFHTRAMVKIQDGCDNFCTFCIIPYVRGRAKSRPLAEILDNVRGLLEKGYKEIVLTGVNMARYLDKSEDPLGAGAPTFEDLLLAILDLPGDFRLRISSLEPEGLGPKFLQAMRHPKMCPHLHLCIQSGSDKILMRMRREYTLDEYRRLVLELRSIDENFNVTTDILYGFPGETEEDLQSTLDLIHELRFGHLHLFPYSKRKGTRAERMDQQINLQEKKRRGEILLSTGEGIKAAYRRSLIGLRQKLLVETVENGWIRGYGEHYIPIKVPLTGVKPERNTWIEVELVGLDEKDDFTMRAETGV